MAKFQFKLQSFLNIKQKIEEQKKNEHGKAVKALEKEKRKKEELIENHTNIVISLRKKMLDGIKPNEMQQYNNYSSYLLKCIKLQEKEIEKAQIVVDKKLKEVIQAMQERKMLEKLREKKYDEYLDEEKKAEQKVVDGIVSFNYKR